MVPPRGSKRPREDEQADEPRRTRLKQEDEGVRNGVRQSAGEEGSKGLKVSTSITTATNGSPKTPRTRTKSSTSPVAERHKRIGHFFDLADDTAAQGSPSMSSEARGSRPESTSTAPAPSSTPATSRSRSPKRSRTRTASSTTGYNENLPDVLSHSAVFPPLAGLLLKNYSPYLLDEPVEAEFSPVLSDEFIRFACAVATPAKWSGRPERLSNGGLDVSGLGRFVGSRQPNKAAIVAAAPLHRSRAYQSITQDLMPKFEAMAAVMRWIWDDEEIALPEVAGMVQTAPLPVYILIRTYASNSRYTRIRNMAFTELHAYLRRLRSLFPAESAALTLLAWLDEPSSRSARLERLYRFFCGRNGERKGVRGWEDWIEGAKKGKSRKLADLDRWEAEEKDGR